MFFKVQDVQIFTARTTLTQQENRHYLVQFKLNQSKVQHNNSAEHWIHRSLSRCWSIFHQNLLVAASFRVSSSQRSSTFPQTLSTAIRDVALPVWANPISTASVHLLRPVNWAQNILNRFEIDSWQTAPHGIWGKIKSDCVECRWICLVSLTRSKISRDVTSRFRQRGGGGDLHVKYHRVFSSTQVWVM